MIERAAVDSHIVFDPRRMTSFRAERRDSRFERTFGPRRRFVEVLGKEAGAIVRGADPEAHGSRIVAS